MSLSNELKAAKARMDAQKREEEQRSKKKKTSTRRVAPLSGATRMKLLPFTFILLMRPSSLKRTTRRRERSL